MKSYILLVLNVFCVLGIAKSQVPVKKVTVRKDKSPNTEIFYVKKNVGNETIKHGEYIFKYNQKVQVNGTYIDNKKEGKWVYTPDNSIRIEGYYKNDLKDSLWVYFRKDKIIAEIRYNQGKEEGLWVSYYSNGNIETKENYVNGKKERLSQLFFENGILHVEANYLNDKYYGTYTVYSKNGDTLYTLRYNEGVPYNLNIYSNGSDGLYLEGDLKEGNGKLIKFYPKYEILKSGENVLTGERTPMIEADFKDGKVHGQVVSYNIFTGDIASKGNYEIGKIVGDWMFYNEKKGWEMKDVSAIADSLQDEHLKLIASNTEIDRVDHRVDIMPLFTNKRPEEGFRKYIAEYLDYPDLAADHGVSGKVLVQFQINNIGAIEDIRILREAAYILNNEAIRVINNSPYWSPGFWNGIPVKVRFVFPVSFVL